MLVIVKYDAHGDGVLKTTYATGSPASGDTLLRIKERWVMAQDTFQYDPEKFKEANQNYIDRIEHEGLVATYDAMLDTLFVEIGGPKEALTEHLVDNIMLRIDLATLKVVGFEILDFLEDFIPSHRIARDAISSWGLSRDTDSTRILTAPQYAPTKEVVTALIGQFTQGASR